MKKLFLIILLFLFVQCNTQKYVVQEPKYTSIMLFDMDGKILAVGSNELKLKNIPKGNYFLRIETNDKCYFKQFEKIFTI